MQPERFKELARAVPHDSVPWFDLLFNSGLLSKWCSSDQAEIRDYVIWLLSPREIVKARGDKIAGLIEIIIAKQGTHAPELKRLFRFAEFGSSQELCRIFLELISAGAFDVDGQHWQSQLHGFAKMYPAVGAKILAKAFDRASILGREQGGTSPFDGREGFFGMDVPTELVFDSARLDPGIFSEEMIPRIAELLRANETVAKDGDILDRIWLFRVFGMAESFKDQVLTSAATGLALLAAQDPARLDRIVAPFVEMPHQNLGYLLLTGWSGNAEHYADKIFDYLLADSRRLDIGYAMWDSGNGISAISRAALTAAGPYCSEEKLRKLEEIIRGYFPFTERDDLKGRGYHQYLLLCALPRERLSSTTISRLQELERKFPGIEAGGPFVSNSDGLVRSPIDKESAGMMSDDQWLSAMKTHNTVDGKRPFRREDDYLVGGAHQFSGVLEHFARKDKPRFANLAQRMDAGFLPTYFDALLRGLSAEPEQLKGESPEAAAEMSILSDEEFEKCILHIHAVSGEEVARWICDAIQRRANHKLSPALTNIVAQHAMTAPDPEIDSWMKKEGAGPMYGGDPLTEGINTTRGSAAHAIAALLFADRSLFARFKEAIESLVHDKSISVRSVAIECLLAMLNFDRKSAMELFLVAVEGDDSILRTHTLRSFVHYTVFSQYEDIRGLLHRMLASSVNEVRKGAAQNIAVAAYGSELAQTDLQKVMAGDEYCRSGVASVDATNFSDEECRETARKRLKEFFNDSSKVVRESASKVFRKMGAKLLVVENELLRAFLESLSFKEHVSTLIYLLKETGEQLPEVVCRIGERATAIHRDGQAEAQWWTHDVGPLVLRLYDQTKDAALQKRCLDIIDSMVEYNFGNVDATMRQLERE